jgi:hypothetical protein
MNHQVGEAAYTKRLGAALDMTNGVVVYHPESGTFRVAFAPPGHLVAPYVDQAIMHGRERIITAAEAVRKADESQILDMLLAVQRHFLTNPGLPEKVAEWRARAWLNQRKLDAHIG